MSLVVELSPPLGKVLQMLQTVSATVSRLLALRLDRVDMLRPAQGLSCVK